MDNILESILKDNTLYNLTILPFDYTSMIKSDVILGQIKIVHTSLEEEKREEEKYKLLKLIYTEIYKQNINREQAIEYFSKAILTEKYKTYLGLAFKFAIQYNSEEDPYTSTFIHLVQFFISDICYEYLWKLDHVEDEQSGKNSIISK